MKLSIITVNYNNREGLQATIESVMHQTWQDFEFLIIDNASTDGSAALIEAHRDRLTFAVSEPDSGIYNAMNKAIRAANGHFLLFLNSGDALNDPDTLARVHGHLTTDHDIYYGDANYLEKDKIVTRHYPDVLSFGFFMEHNLSHQASFIRKTLFETLFFYNEGYKIVSDWEFFICAICKYNVPYKHLPIIVCKYNTEGISSMIENHPAMHKERAAVIEQHFPLFMDEYQHVAQLNSKRFKQFLHIRQYPVAFKILKGFMSLLIFLLPKNK